jgi:hypothetical protein
MSQFSSLLINSFFCLVKNITDHIVDSTSSISNDQLVDSSSLPPIDEVLSRSSDNTIIGINNFYWSPVETFIFLCGRRLIALGGCCYSIYDYAR